MFLVNFRSVPIVHFKCKLSTQFYEQKSKYLTSKLQPAQTEKKLYLAHKIQFIWASGQIKLLLAVQLFRRISILQLMKLADLNYRIVLRL